MVVTEPASDSPSSIRALFQHYCKELDESHAQRELLVNASRAITQRSKKLIFALHRLPIPSASTPPPSPSTPASPDLPRLTTELDAITFLIATSIGAGLRPGDAVRLHRAISPGLQEYMEAAVFLHYLRDGTLADRDALESHLAAACRAADASAVPICPGDYVLGVADVGGELMRYAVAAAARGGVACAMHAREFMGTLQAVLETAGGSVATGVAKEIRQKKSVLAQSIAKVERACFDYAVRRAEFPDGAVPAARPGEDDAGATRAKRRRVE